MQEKEIHLRDYLRLIFKRKYSVITVFLVVFIISLVGTFSMTPVYQATVKVLIRKNEPKVVTPNAPFSFDYDPEFSETQSQMIKSTLVGDRVVSTLQLENTYDSFFREKKGLNIADRTVQWFSQLFATALHVAGKTDKKADSRDTANTNEVLTKGQILSRMISASLVVAPVKESRVVNISYSSTNPKLAAMIVNSVAQAYKDVTLEMRMSSASYEIQWLTKKADEERVKLENSEKALQNYMKSSDIVTLENKLTMVPERLSEVAQKIAESETKRKEMESLYAMVKDISDDVEAADTIPAIRSDHTVQSLRIQILEAEKKIVDLSDTHGPKHPAMLQAINDLAGLKEKKKREVKRVIETIKNEYKLSKANEENFRRHAEGTKSELLALREKFVQYDALKREDETNRQLYNAIIAKIKEQGITQDVSTVDIWVLQKADVPVSPSSPKKSKNLLLGALLGLFGGIGLAFFIEYLDNTVKTPEDFEERFNLPVLGTIEYFKGDGSIEKVVVDQPRAIITEQYKSLRTAILLSSAESPPKRLLVTSMEPGEGKTVTSINLAMTIALAEYSVLLIDTDLRKSALHRVFDLPNEKGLSTYLTGTSDEDVIIQGPVKNLSFMTAGPSSPNPAELLDSLRMKKLLEKLAERFDIIILDSSPLLAVTDSLVLSKEVDGTVIVTYSGKTTYDGVRRGTKLLEDVKAHVLGVIINAFDMRKSGYYYRKYYHYGYSTKGAPGKEPTA